MIAVGRARLALGLAAGLRLASGGAFAADDFTIYNIVPFSNGNERQTAADILEYRERTGQDTALYTLTLNPFGKPATDQARFKIESYRRLRRELEGRGIRLGVLLQAIIGHGWPSAAAECEGWQRTIDIDGRVKRFCPLDPDFRKYVADAVREIAEIGAAFVMTDDDCRSFSPETECFCPLHAAEFNRRTGSSHTGESLRAAVAASRPGDAVQNAFAALQRDTVAGLMRLVRETLDSVDPTIRTCCCTPGQNREVTYVPTYAKELAAKGQPTTVRVDNGYYVERSVREFPHVALFTMGVCDFLRGKVDVLLDEADTCPQNLWAKSAVSFHSHMALAALCGCSGAKAWYVNAHKGEVPVSRNYTDILAARRGFLGGLARAVRDSEMTGVAIPCADGFAAGVDVRLPRYQIPPGADTWVDGSLGVMGVPFRATFDKEADAVYALGGKLEDLSDGELREILRHRALVDSDAAAAICGRGLGDLIGVGIKPRTEPLKFDFEADAATGDIVPFSHGSGAPEFEVAAGGRVCSWLCGRRAAPPSWNLRENEKGYMKIAPGAVLFRNGLGGRVLTVAWHSHPFVLEHYSERRQRWLWRMLDRVAGAPVDNLVANPQDVMAVTRHFRDGSDLVAAFNLNFDPIRRLGVRRAVRPESVERLGSDGSWVPVDFAWRDSVAEVDAGALPYDLLVLRIRGAAPAAGPKVTVIGDSISTFGGVSVYRSHYPNYDVKSVDQTWWMTAIRAIGGTLSCNAAWTGTKVCGAGDNAMSSDYRLDALRLGDPDLFLVFAGTNDARGRHALGEFAFDADGDRTKFRPAFIRLMRALRTGYPAAKVLVVLNTDIDSGLGVTEADWAPYADSMKAIAERFGARTVQLRGYSRVSETYDGVTYRVHPDAAGMADIGRQVADAYLRYEKDGWKD